MDIFYGSNFPSNVIDYYQSIKGSFTPEQFGVFLNMPSSNVHENYLVAFHEHYHYWQSIFTPYGHLKWGCYRTVSTEVIDLWLKATAETPEGRTIPAGSMLPCQSIRQLSCVAQIYVQDFASRVVSLEERISCDPEIREIIPISIDDTCPKIHLMGQEYQLNGIDILESYAKFQEANLAYIVDEKPLHETIDSTKLGPEYFSALAYFTEHIGWERIIEFPILCEIALSADKLCKFDDATWKEYHPAWRFVTMVDTIAAYDSTNYLKYENIKSSFSGYVEKLLMDCHFDDSAHCWDSAVAYASQNDLNISRDMLRAIAFKKKYPWALSFPFVDMDVYCEMKEFHPYFYITSDSTIYTVDSQSLGNEVIFENQYQAFAHQIRGNMSPRCQDRAKIQCGFSYYGLQGCKYQASGECDGHIDHDSKLPQLKTDAEGVILEGCPFAIFLGLMGVEVKNLNITNIAKKIDYKLLAENAKAIKETL